MAEEDRTIQTSLQPATREPSQLETAMMIADQLGETEDAQKQQIGIIVRTLGRTQARALLDETLQIEAQGGKVLPLPAGVRSLGGLELEPPNFFSTHDGILPASK